MADGPIQGVKTPKFGICVDRSNGIKRRCVLSKDSCQQFNELYQAPFETTEFCDSPTDVNVGRCTSSLDDKRCGPSEAACGTKSPFYSREETTQCSLVQDDKDIENPRTTFPACTDSKRNLYQCVLDDSDCYGNERLVYAKWASEWGPHPCFCEDVPTGVCFQQSTYIITPNNSHCAVSMNDCNVQAGFSFMNAREFLESERASYECRMCDFQKVQASASSSSSSGSSPISFVSAGACLDTGVPKTSFEARDFEKCALESSDCSSNNGFLSAPLLEKHNLSCPLKHTSNWGICTSSGDPVDCTNKEESCLYNFRFERSNDPSKCDIHGSSETGIPTYFPYCAPRTDNDDKDWREIRCVWDEFECDLEKERWEEARLPNNAWFKGCTCEDVFTGACKEPSTNQYHCAVSAKGCTDPASYVPQRLLKERGIDLVCKLCPPRPPDAPQKSAPTPAPVVAVAPTVSPLASMPAHASIPTYSPVAVVRPTLPPVSWPDAQSAYNAQAQQQTTQKQQDLSTGAVAGIAFGCMALVGLFVLVYTLFSGDKEAHSFEKEAGSDIPNNPSIDEEDDVIIKEIDDDYVEPVSPKANII